MRALEPKPTSPAPAGMARRGAFRRALLGIPLFHKILLANAGASLLALAVALTLLHGNGWLQPGTLFAAFAGVAIAVPLQALVLLLALTPLDGLEDVAERVANGEPAARVEPSALADRRLSHLGEVLNRLLDSLAAERDRLRDVARRAFHAQEAERVRIAAELQEETAQSLSGLLLRLRALRRIDNAEKRDAMIEEARAEAASAAERVRRFADSLNPPALADLGLGPAVEAYARGLEQATGLAVEVQADVPRQGVDPDAALALYRIVQEALSNVLRHSGASSAHVTLARRGDWVEAEVQDDGRGFPFGEVLMHAPCLGIFGMRERALYAGGQATVESAPGGGTRVRARVPTIVRDPLAVVCAPPAETLISAAASL